VRSFLTWLKLSDDELSATMTLSGLGEETGKVRRCYRRVRFDGPLAVCTYPSPAKQPAVYITLGIRRHVKSLEIVALIQSLVEKEPLEPVGKGRANVWGSSSMEP
jgi:hypothetical protein